ncbi:hypothetical protein D1871_18915 [Nakamurella silvestris]|nr:hypothetical protein D1871_18915 [Nakamurella silvestris]
MRQSTFDPRALAPPENDISYVVFFWEQGEGPPGTPPSQVGYRCEEHLLEDTTFDEVEQWIGDNARGRTHELFIVFGRGAAATSHRLRGQDPTVDDEPGHRSAFVAWLPDPE